MTTGHKIAATFGAVIALLLGVALCGYWSGRWEENVQPFSLASAESRPEICMDEATRERIKTVMMDALDESLKNHIVHTFEIWMKDDRAQPERARTGVQNGLKAYLASRKGVLEWMPPPCAG